MNKKGFTLIELLAVIIILGILMIIAIPSVTKYISDSRKSAYIDTAKEIISGARNKVNDGKLGMYGTDTTYYIPVDYIKSENATKSPYGDFVEAYVVVTFDGKGYKYYWISVDDAGQGVKNIIAYDKLETDDIESDIDPVDIKDIVEHTVIENRNKIKILDPNTETWKEPVGEITNHLPEEGAGSSSNNAVVYPTGKTKDTVVTGDIVTIDTEEFYVVKHDGNDLILLSKYNLKVGKILDNNWNEIGELSNNDDGYGKQSSDTRGYVVDSEVYNGMIPFSNINYWDDNVGTNYPGTYCSNNTYTTGTKCAYVYDNNSSLSQYINNYKTYLERKGATIKSARLLSVEEAFELGCGNGAWNCNNAPDFIKNTSYWLGSVGNSFTIWGIDTDGGFDSTGSFDYENYGIRPVIVI